MPHINVLSKEISELIAAGEVIERPSSVIKELVENSIDSGAKHITVEIKNGGVTYMRVTDDGCGISYDEVPTAFLRHATSKVASKNDLNNIYTLGFRGEALASVAAVSRVELMTKQQNEELGTLYTIEGSTEKSHEKIGCPDGTTIIIRDLFYNVPARAKFMKKDVTEANAVSHIVQKITLSHPEIAFRLIRDNRTEFNSAGDGELFSAIYAVYGRDFSRDMVPVDYEYQGVRVHGYAIKPLYSRKNRAFQNFFVNGRYVRSALCSYALENAFENMIMTGKFPACVLMIELSAADLDVNIHPAKAEVRFTDEKKVSNAVYFAVKNGLVSSGLIYEIEMPQHKDWSDHSKENEGYDQQMILTPVSDIKKAEESLQSSSPGFSRETHEILQKPAEIQPVYTAPEPAQKPQHEFRNSGISPILNGVNIIADEEDDNEPDITEEDTAPVSVPEPVKPEIPAPVEGFQFINSSSFSRTAPPEEPVPVIAAEPQKDEFSGLRVIGEAFKMYVICECDNKIIIIDKHAAHERIIFERLRSRNCRQYSQKLLTGVKVLLTSEERDVMQSNVELLADLGFEFDFTKPPCVIATAVPTFIMELEMEKIICEVAENLRLHKQNPQSGELDDILHTVACKSAIKAGDKNSPEEMLALAQQVCGDERIRHCPHGRPVMFTMTKSNLDHQFRRT